MSPAATEERIGSDVLFAEPTDPACRATVVVPARNEAQGLPATLDALRLQIDLDGQPLDPATYDVLLLLNNCTDSSARVAREYARRHASFSLHVAEVTLEPERAHVGTARRMLMDAAWERLDERAPGAGVILSTDADTLVAPDWLAANLAAIERGAEVVGGVIDLFAEDLAALEPGVRLAYERDRRLQELVAELESRLDPDPADPFPRHLQHFGASLACTCEVYRRSGGLPPVKPLEDVAFIERLRHVGARIRHAPEVRISTSARLDGRAEVGLSGQLRHWQRESAEGLPHEVDSCAWMVHRFRLMGLLRAFAAGTSDEVLDGLGAEWRERLVGARQLDLQGSAFLAEIDCNRFIAESFREERRGEIVTVLAEIEAVLVSLAPA